MCIILGIHGFAFLGRKTEAHCSVSQTSPGLNGKELSILDKLLSGPSTGTGSDVSLGAAQGHLVLLLSSLPPFLKVFTREGKTPDQMGSVIHCYYCTDRAHFSSWS